MKKFLIIAGSAIAVIIIALAAFIKIYVTPEKVKAYIIPAVEKSLNRKISIGEIEIGLIKGIGLKDFTIKELDQTTDFVRCKDFVLKFQLMPLLSKKVIIDKMNVASPYIRIERGKDGKYNFSDIRKQQIPEEAKEADKGKGLPISLLVNKIAISDAKISLTDLKKELPDLKCSTDINISIKSSDGSELSTEGSVDITIDEAVLRKPAEKHIKNIASKLDYAVHVNLESNDIFIDKADINIQQIAASVSGVVKNFKTSPELDISVNLPKAKAADLQQLAALFTNLKDISLSGHLAANMTVKGMLKQLESMKAKGTISLEQLGVAYKEIKALLSGKIKLNEQTMNIDLSGSSGRNSATLTGSVSNLFKNQIVNLNIYSKKLYIEELIPAGKAGTGNTPQSDKAAKVKSAPLKEAEPLKLKLSASGEVKIDSAIYKGMDMTNYYMKYIFKDNKLEIPQMTADAGKGKFNLNTLIDLSKPGYTYNLTTKIDSLHAEEIVNSFFPKAKDKVFGTITTNLKLSGNGTLPQSIKKNLIADGDFNIIDGKITDAEITNKLSLFLNVSELETINFRKAEGTVKIRNSIAKLNSIFKSDDFAMDPKGNIGLDETLDLAFDLKLSPRLTDKAVTSKIGKYMKDEGGWGTIPLLVSGTFSDPKYAPDLAKVGKQVIERKVDKLLDNLFNKGKAKEQPQQPLTEEQKSQDQKPEDGLKDLLKSLPGKLF